MSEAALDTDRGEAIRQMLDRTIQRGLKGIRYAASSPPNVGMTPKDVVLERGTMRLYHYRPMVDEVYRIPVLMVMATSNRGYIFDLTPGNSMVEYLLEQGFDVFVLDWEAPTPEERNLDLGSYTQDFIPACIRQVQEQTGEEDVNIVAYCAGGMLSLMYAATHPKGPLKNLACFTTPVNHKEMALMAQWQDERYFDVDRLVDTLGVVPEEQVMRGFDMLRPAQKPAGRIKLMDMMWNDDFVESYRLFDRWGKETLPLAGEYYRQTVKELGWGNKLYTGELVIRGKSANLANITIPVLHITAQHDHIVPTGASAPLLELVSSEDKTGIELKGGHVSLIAGPSARLRMWPALVDWLAERST